MVAGNASSAPGWPWAHARRQLMYTLTPLVAFAMAWWSSALLTTPLIWNEAIAYSIAHLALIGLRRMAWLRVTLSVGLSLVLDLLFSLLLLYQAGQLGHAFYPLFALVALRALSVYRITPVATAVPFLLGPLYLFFVILATPFAAQPPHDQYAALALLAGSLGFGIAAIWSSTATVRLNVQLQQELHDAKRAAELRVAQLERSTNDLRARMREQHALEEGLRVITSSLSLDEVLGQIVDSTIQMLGLARIHGVALSLSTSDGFEHRTASSEVAICKQVADAIARHTVEKQIPLIITDSAHNRVLANLDHTICSALSVPLFVGSGEVRGALTVVSRECGIYDSTDARHLSALATQAGIAIQNAELHSRMQQQRQLLEAVMRDITEAMVVLDAQQQVVLVNPLGRRLMDADQNAAIREQILDLAAAMRTEGHQILAREMRTHSDDDESKGSTFQAWASLVRQPSDDEMLIAIVLHDITAQKVEERGKQEFISMVAHELRNPLHSMNGFVKLVLQGKVGPLTDMQQEFLEIVDSQIELLNGRIAELLEYNRVQSGRLVLNPQRGDMPMLVSGTITRLKYQAENNDLQLVNDVAADLPQCYFDSERIGQVLTNLIENAIKATPAGGTIRVRSEVHEDELWLRVQDTGVGIAEEDIDKVFRAFYRAHDQASSKGNHLGLGLAICAQIIEGHRGRIWVESELGRGSVFSFALPLISQERALSTSMAL